MNDDEKDDLKKGFPNSIAWLLMGFFLFIFMIQNYIDPRLAKVSFSYQLEHLVNLQLLQPEDSRKIALNDNLVTFSGKFRDRVTEEGKNRFKYLELLNAKHELINEQNQTLDNLKNLRKRLVESSTYFLQLVGSPVPTGGYVVVNDLINVPTEDSHIIVTSVPKKENFINFSQLNAQFTEVKANPTEESANAFGKNLTQLIRYFRSPILGIGNESLKEELKNLEIQVNKANGVNNQAMTYEKALNSLQAIINDLNKIEDNIRLLKLRSVRNYKEAIDQYNQLSSRVEDNQVQLDKARQAVASVIWYFNNQEISTRALEKQDPEIYHQWFLNAKEEWNNFTQNHNGTFRAPDQPVNLVLQKTFKSEEPAPNYLSYLFTMLPILFVLGILYFVFTKQMKGVGSNAMSFGKSPARMVSKGNTKITFKDVAGADEALEELHEIVEFLKNPQKFTTLGGRIPKGVLCVGPPGTGKTLIAKAVAGEADCPFFSISGSEFVEMFVGVGASRIRDLFDQAKKQAPCIIFIDEIDAVGRHRGAGIGGGHDEREQTLNQLLVEMDGFNTNEGVILMAATNRPDVLDRALLRPGRFDRRVVIGLPDIKGRFDILKVHARKIKMDPSVDLLSIARSTPGCSGADLANILNEAALLAARRGRSAVTQQETAEARDKVLYGKERRSLELDEEEKKTTAFHEAGHTIVSLIVKHSDPVDKVTIIPRGFSLGSTQFLPKKNRVSYWRKELHDQLAVLMGGRCAEKIFVDDISSGAQQDIERATQLARNMVCKWGMSDKIGVVTYDNSSDSQGMPDHSDKTYSEETAKEIDREVRLFLDEANKTATQIINDHRQHVEIMAQMLIEFETLDSQDIDDILNNRWNDAQKRERLKIAEDLHKKSLPTPPPPPPLEAQ